MPEKLKYAPNIIVIGAAKCGTSTVYSYLHQHPEVFMSRIKETNYFAKDIKPEEFSPIYKKRERDKAFDISAFLKDPTETRFLAYVQESQHYEALFAEGKDAKLRGEVSNSYMYSDVAAKEIAQTIPEAKIIAVVRQPAERMFSHYLNKLRDGQISASFERALAQDRSAAIKGWGKSHLFYELGQYGTQLKKFYNCFPAEQICVLSYDTLQNQPEQFFGQLNDFLDIETMAMPEVPRENRAAVPRSATLNHWITKTGVKKRVFSRIPKALQMNVKSLFLTQRGVPKLSPDKVRELTALYIDEIKETERLTELDLSSWYGR